MPERSQRCMSSDHDGRFGLTLTIRKNKSEGARIRRLIGFILGAAVRFFVAKNTLFIMAMAAILSIYRCDVTFWMINGIFSMWTERIALRIAYISELLILIHGLISCLLRKLVFQLLFFALENNANAFSSRNCTRSPHNTACCQKDKHKSFFELPFCF